MGVIMFLIVIAAIVGGLAIGAVVLSGASSIGTRSNHELRTVRYQLKEARKALYSIASENSGNPRLEAQLALEEMDRKELES